MGQRDPQAGLPDVEGVSPAETPEVCRLLRTKNAFGVEATGARWKTGTSTTDTFWCLNTMEAFGPDDNYVHASACQRGRCCYQRCDTDADVEVA